MPGPDDPGTGGGGGGTGHIRIPREIPQELPAFLTRSLASEIIQIRNRLNAFENATIMARFGGGAAGIIGGPNELPNPDDPGGGGFGGGSFPGEIPREIPQELPVFSQIETVIESRVSALRTEILGELEQIRAEIKQQRG
jgi:hypothetical protein